MHTRLVTIATQLWLDLTLFCKHVISIDASDVYFVRIIRMKACEEDGLSTFPTDEFFTCSMHNIALALITQEAPSAYLLDKLCSINDRRSQNRALKRRCSTFSTT